MSKQKDEMNNPQEESGLKKEEQKSFDEILHHLLVIGLVISVILLLTGLTLSLVTHQGLPTKVLTLQSVFQSVFALQVSGFISLGLLVLIATPVVRVISSFIAFLVERDWRFAGITLIVLVTVTISVFFGKY
jgi:uncharacterized membrane protein